MSTALAREYKFFSAVDRPLFFQDVFDIFPYFGDKPYTQNLRWVRIPTGATVCSARCSRSITLPRS